MRLLTAGSLVRVQLGEPKNPLSTVGVDDAGGPPVPIPNTEVKPCSAENTWLATAREDRKMPTSDSGFFFVKYHFYAVNSHMGVNYSPVWLLTVY